MSRTAKRFLFLLVLAGWAGAGAAVISLTGCYSQKGGAMPYTGGAETYFSSEFSPKSLRLVDLRSGETVFQMDIPVGKQLTFDFVTGKGDDPVMTPDLMRYQLFAIGTSTGKLRNSLSVPNASSRRIEYWIRPTPEYAPVPPGEEIRIDKKADRPPYWTPQGGPMPDNPGTGMYDG